MFTGTVVNDQVVASLPDQEQFLGSIAFGDGLLKLATGNADEGQFNTMVGLSAGLDLTTGRYNTCLGYFAGRYMTGLDTATTYSPDPAGAMPGIGNHGNTFVGYLTGAAANGALDNTMVGVKCGLNLRTGMDNTGFGINTLESINGGSENAFFGHAGMRAVVGWGKFGVDDYDNSVETGGDGHRNTGCGDMAGRLLNGPSGNEKSKGRCNVYVGARTTSLADYTVNENVFGYGAEGQGTDTISYGNANITAHHFNAGSVFMHQLGAGTNGPNLNIDSATGEIGVGAEGLAVDDYDVGGHPNWRSSNVELLQFGPSAGEYAWIAIRQIGVGTDTAYTYFDGALNGSNRFSCLGTNSIEFQFAPYVGNNRVVTEISGAVGYRSGGAITQMTSKNTAVTLNAFASEITLNAASLSAGESATFTVNNNKIQANDQIIATHHSGGTFGAYTIAGRATGTGVGAITVRNNTGTTLAEAIVIKATIFRAPDA